LIELDATKLLKSFRCEDVAFVVDGILTQSTLSKALWAIKKRRCNALFLRDPAYRFGHPQKREITIEKILRNPYRGQDLMELTMAEMAELYTVVTDSKEPKQRGLALRYLTLACKRKYGVHPQPSIYLTMPATAGLTRRAIMDFLASLLHSSRLPIAVKNMLLQLSALCVEHGFHPTHKSYRLFHSIIRRAEPQLRFSGDVPTTAEALRFSSDLKDIPICPVDKNKGAAHVTCPRL